jgi:hypothetical protein
MAVEIGGLPVFDADAMGRAFLAVRISEPVSEQILLKCRENRGTRDGMSTPECLELIEGLSDCRETVDLRADAVDRRLEAIGHRLEAIERLLASRDDRLDAAGLRVIPGERRLTLLEHRLESLRREAAQPRVELFDRLDEADRRLDRLEDNYRAIERALHRVVSLLTPPGAPSGTQARGLVPPRAASSRTV